MLEKQTDCRGVRDPTDLKEVHSYNLHFWPPFVA